MRKIRNILTILVLTTSSLGLAAAAKASDGSSGLYLAHDSHHYSYPGERHYHRPKPRYHGHEYGRPGHKHYRHYRKHRDHYRGDLRRHHRPYYSRAYRTSSPGSVTPLGRLADYKITHTVNVRTYRF